MHIQQETAIIEEEEVSLVDLHKLAAQGEMYLDWLEVLKLECDNKILFCFT